MFLMHGHSLFFLGGPIFTETNDIKKMINVPKTFGLTCVAWGTLWYFVLVFGGILGIPSVTAIDWNKDRSSQMAAGIEHTLFEPHKYKLKTLLQPQAPTLSDIPWLWPWLQLSPSQSGWIAPYAAGQCRFLVPGWSTAIRRSKSTHLPSSPECFSSADRRAACWRYGMMMHDEWQKDTKRWRMKRSCQWRKFCFAVALVTRWHTTMIIYTLYMDIICILFRHILQWCLHPKLIIITL